MKNEEIKKPKNKKKGGIVNYLMGGRLFTSKLITENTWLLALIVLYAFIYVSNRYEYEQGLLKIDRLTKERNRMKNNLLTMKSEFSYKSRQTEVEKMLKENKSDLKAPKNPIYTIKK